MPKKQSTASQFQFQGFLSPNYTQVPDQVFDELLPLLSGAELKVLLYIIRRTFGFKKDHDEISLNQICSGIQTRDGRVLDYGTGLSQSTVLVAVKGLLEKQIILAQRRMSQEKGNEPTLYHLNLREGFPENRGRGGTKIGEGLPRKPRTQETVLQETEKQQTATSNHFEVLKLDIKSENSPFRDSANLREFENDIALNRTRSDRNVPTLSGALTPVAGIVKTRRKRPPQSAPDRPGAAAPRRTASIASSSEAGLSGRSRTGRRRSLADEAPPAIAALIEQFSGEFHDAEHARSNISQAVKLWRATGMADTTFCTALYTARTKTQKAPGVEKRAAGEAGEWGMRNKMPYFFACLRDVLGLKQDAPTS